ncbi:MAG: lipocalin family protein, partial [Flavobacteriales bacterium]
MKKLLLFIIISSFLTTGCQKYSDGGLVSKADKRLSAHTWKLEKYLRNGNDETSQLLISNFTENFAENGTITRSYTDPNGDPFSESGNWSFDNDKMQINLTGVGSI